MFENITASMDIHTSSLQHPHSLVSTLHERETEGREVTAYKQCLSLPMLRVCVCVCVCVCMCSVSCVRTCVCVTVCVIERETAMSVCTGKCGS